MEPAVKGRARARATATLIGLLALALATQATPAVSRYQLASGLQLIVERVPDAPLTAIEVWIRAGVACETPESSGVAHLLEHLIFKGTAQLPPGALDETFEQAGGVLDAATERDWTRFYASVLPDRWQKPLQTLLQCLFHPRLPPEALEQERQLILRDEYALHEADPIRPARYALFARAFPEHPYGLPLLGRRETLARIDRGTLQRFHQDHYRPDRMVVVVVGAAEPEAVREAVEAAVRDLPAMPAQSLPAPPAPHAKSAGEPVFAAHRACLAFGLKTPPAPLIEGWLCAEIVRTALAEPYRGLLYEGERLPFGRLQSEYLPRVQGSLIAFYALPPVPEQDDWQATLRQRWERALQRIAQGDARAALEQARAVALARHEASTRNLLERARWHGLCAALGIPLSPEEYAARLNQLPIEQVEAFVRAMQVAASSADGAADRTPDTVAVSRLRDEPGAGRLAALGDPAARGARRTVARQRLANGLRLVAVFAPDAESVVIQVAVAHRQSEFSPAVGELTARMLFGETQNETERTLAARMARSGGSLRIEWTPAGTLITAFARPDSVVNVLALLKEALFRAELTEAALQRAVAHALYDRQHQEGAQGWRLAAREGTLLADESALQRVTLNAVRRYYEAHYRPENTVMVIAGARRAEQLTEFVRALFGSEWEGGATRRQEAPPPLPRLEIRALTDSRRLGYAGYLWAVPEVARMEYHALQAWQLLLGEGKRARLFMELRERRGIGYALGTQTYLLRGGVAGIGWVQTAESPADSAMLRAILTQPVQPGEHTRAMALLRGEWERLRLNLPAFAAALAWAELSGLGYEAVWDAPPAGETLPLPMLEAVRRRLLHLSSVQLE